MKSILFLGLVLVCSLLVSSVFADNPSPPQAAAAPAPPSPPHTETHAAPAHAAPPAPPAPAATPTPATPATPAPAAAQPAQPAPVAEHHHQKIEADVSNLNVLLNQQAEKLRQVSEELGHIKVSASTTISSSALDALKLDVENSIDSFSKNADHNAKLLAENVQSIRSSEEKLSKQYEALEAKIAKLEKVAAEEKQTLQQIDAAFKAFKTEVNEKLAKAATAQGGFDFTFDWDTISAAIVSKSKEYAQKAWELLVYLYERALKEIAAFRAESIPSREEGEKLVKEWWENAQTFYFETVQPAAVQLYQTARQYFDEATEQLTDLLAEKAAVPKETARLIALSFLALTSGVIAFVVFLIVLQILQFILSIIFYFLCCRFCRSSKNKNKNKKDKKASTPAPATASSASANPSKTTAVPPPVTKKDNKPGPKSPSLNKTQQ